MVSQAPMLNPLRGETRAQPGSDAGERGTRPSGGQMEPTEIIEVDSEIVACDGGGEPLGHPRVFLSMEGKGEIECPYCSRRFVLKPGAAEDVAGAAGGP